MLAINHACGLSLGRDNGVTIVRDISKLRIDATWIHKSWGDSHKQLEGLAGGLNLVLFFEVHPDSQEIDTYAPLSIPEVPRGTQKEREPNGDVVTNTFWRQRNCSQGAGDGSSWVWLASSGGFLHNGPSCLR